MLNQTSALPGTVMSITHLISHETFLNPHQMGNSTRRKNAGVKYELCDLGLVP